MAYTFQHISAFLHSPRESHVHALHHTLRYVQGTTRQGILLCGFTKPILQAYSDSYWGACPDNGKSITVYIMMLGNSPINWKSIKQGMISKWSCEAEYRALVSAASEITWFVRLLQEFQVHNLTPITLHCKIQSFMHIGRILCFMNTLNM